MHVYFYGVVHSDSIACYVGGSKLTPQDIMRGFPKLATGFYKQVSQLSS